MKTNCCYKGLCVYKSTVKPLYRIIWPLVKKYVKEHGIRVEAELLKRYVATYTFYHEYRELGEEPGPILLDMLHEYRTLLPCDDRCRLEEYLDKVLSTPASLGDRSKYVSECGWSQCIREHELTLMFTREQIMMIPGFLPSEYKGYLVFCNENTCVPLRGLYPTGTDFALVRREDIRDYFRKKYGASSLFKALSLDKTIEYAALKIEATLYCTRVIVFVKTPYPYILAKKIECMRRDYYRIISELRDEIAELAEAIEKALELEEIDSYGE